MDRRKVVAGVAVVAAAVVIGVLVLGSGDDDDGGGGRADEPGPAETVTAESTAYTPDTFTVTEGEYVRFVNNDDVTHTFTADDGLFDSGEVEPGSDYRYAFDGPITVTFHCEIHPSMTGTVEVTAGD
jgi:plastocyanin